MGDSLNDDTADNVEMHTISAESPTALLQEATEDTQENRSSLVGASFNFINSIVGAGIIGLPFAIREAGFVSGIILLLAVGLITDYSVRLLVRAGIKAKKVDYEELCSHALGTPGFYLVAFFMFTFAYGAMVAYFIVIGDTVPKVALSLWGSGSILANRQFVVVLAGVVAMLPLCLLKDMSSLAKTSMVSIAADVVIVLVVISRAPVAHAANPAYAADVQSQPFSFIRGSFFGGLGAMSFAFVCQHSSFIVFKSLQNPTNRRWSLVCRSSVATALVLCLTLSLSGYLNFFDLTRSDVLDNFSDTDTAINVARLLLALTMVFTFPMEQFVARQSVHSLLFRGRGGMNNWRHYTITLCLWGSALLIGVFVTNLGVVLELTGAFSASALGYILPSLCHLRVSGFQKLTHAASQAWASDSSRYEPTLMGRLRVTGELVLPLLMLAFGVVAMVVGTASALSPGA